MTPFIKDGGDLDEILSRGSHIDLGVHLFTLSKSDFKLIFYLLKQSGETKKDYVNTRVKKIRLHTEQSPGIIYRGLKKLVSIGLLIRKSKTEHWLNPRHLNIGFQKEEWRIRCRNEWPEVYIKHYV